MRLKKEIKFKVWYILIGFIILCISVLVAVMQLDNIQSVKSAIKGYVYSLSSTDLDKMLPLDDEIDSWHNKEEYLIAHACGAVDGEIYLNSYEAIENSIKLGFEIIEVDFTATSDGIYVCRHNWSDDLQYANWSDNPPTYEEFINTKILERYTPINLMDIVGLVNSYEYLQVICDVKIQTESEAAEFAEQLLEAVYDSGNQELINRFIILTPYEDVYFGMMKIFDFPNWIYWLKSEHKFKQGISFMLNNGINTATISYGAFDDINTLKIFKDYGIYTMVYSIDSIAEAVTWYGIVDMIYTNYIYESIIENHILQYN